MYLYAWYVCLCACAGELYNVDSDAQRLKSMTMEASIDEDDLLAFKSHAPCTFEKEFFSVCM